MSTYMAVYRKVTMLTCKKCCGYIILYIYSTVHTCMTIKGVIFSYKYIECKLSGYYLGHVKEREERMCGCIFMCAATSQLYHFHCLNTRSFVSSPHLKLMSRQLWDKPIQSCIYTIVGLQMTSPNIFLHS